MPTSGRNEPGENQDAGESEGRIILSDVAPKVELELFVIFNRGLQITSHPIMGRVMVASKDLGAELLYEPILREYPALVCKQQDYMDYMEKFLDAPTEIQVGLLDMFFQPLDSPMGQSLVEPAKLLYLLGVLEDFKVLHQLLSILMTNGHQYQQELSAIPLFASKFSHSCAPNVGYSSVSSGKDGALEYKLLQPVQEGELVCFSYLADLLETPTSERRQLLMETKSFWCECDRCRGPDYCRCLPCQRCGESTPCRYRDATNAVDGDEAYWYCSGCEQLKDSAPMLSLELSMAKTLDVISRSVENKEVTLHSMYNPEAIEELVHECCSELSLTHHLTVKALRLLFSTSTARAFKYIKRTFTVGGKGGSATLGGEDVSLRNAIFQSFRKSVIAGYQLVLAGECVASSCSGCYLEPLGEEEIKSNRRRSRLRLIPQHAPNYDRTVPFRHVCENLMQLPLHWWPPLAWGMTRRYMPVMKAKFGALVEELERDLIDRWEGVQCYECGTYWDAKTGKTKVAARETAEVSVPTRKEDKAKTKRKKGKKKRR